MNSISWACCVLNSSMVILVPFMRHDPGLALMLELGDVTGQVSAKEGHEVGRHFDLVRVFGNNGVIEALHSFGKIGHIQSLRQGIVPHQGKDGASEEFLRFWVHGWGWVLICLRRM